MDERAVEQPAGHENIPQDLALTVEREQMELLDREIAQARLEQAHNVFRLADARQRGATLARDSSGQLERRDQPRGFAGPDTHEPHQFGGRPGGKPAE